MEKEIINIAGCPTAWNQLSTRQIESLMPLYVMYGDNQDMLRAFSLLVLNDLKLLNVEPDIINDKSYYIVQRTTEKKWYQRNDVLRFPICADTLRSFANEFMNFLTEPCSLTRAPYPVITVGFKKFASAANQLASMNWIQYNDASVLYSGFRKCESNAMKFLKKGNKAQARKLEKQAEQYLGMFLATIYTPYGKKYKQGQGERYGSLMRRFMSDEKKAISLLFWDGCMLFMNSHFKYIFTKSGGNKSSSKDYIVETTAVTAMLIEELKQSSPTIFAESAYTILSVLNNMQHKAKAMEDSMKKNKK